MAHVLISKKRRTARAAKGREMWSVRTMWRNVPLEPSDSIKAQCARIECIKRTRLEESGNVSGLATTYDSHRQLTTCCILCNETDSNALVLRPDTALDDDITPFSKPVLEFSAVWRISLLVLFES